MKHLPNLGALLLIAAICIAPAVQAADPAASLDSLDRHFAQQLAVLAEKCDSLKMTEQAQFTRDWQIKRQDKQQRLFIPAVSDPATPPPNAPDLVKRWHSKFQELRIDQANGLYDVALEFLEGGDAARAYQLLHEALREDPNHESARKGLSYSRSKDGMRWNPYARPPESAVGRTPHPKTGWATGKYWRIDSPHWRIATNHSAAAGLDLAKRLEDFHCLWKQIFFDYWCTRAALEAALEAGTRLPGPTVPMNVLLFRNREEYVKYLVASQPKIALTQGFYSDEQRTAIFFVGDESIHPTWFHEAAHQLFQEWRGAPQGVGEKHNFWLVEGAAMYVESLHHHGSHWTVGGWQSDRLQIPRYRALSGDKGLPLQQLVALGREQVQTNSDIRKLYSQFAAEAHFLLDHADPAYRQAGNALLREIYAQNDKLTSLASLTGKSLEELDREYLQSFQVTDDDLLSTPGLSDARNLALGRTQVTEKGLAALANCRELRWVELTGLPVADEGLAHLKNATKLDQLFLDSTKITNRSLPLITQFAALEELDLSNTQVNDESIAMLGKLRKLRTLHLTGSQVTAAGVQRLKAVLPKTDIQH